MNLGYLFFFLATVIAVSPVFFLLNEHLRFLALVLSPISASILYVTALALLGRLFVFSSRSAGLVSERRWTRELYAKAWALFESTAPLYAYSLKFRPVRAVLFRTFGYTGELGFHLAANARLVEPSWIRLSKDVAVRSAAALAPSLTLSTGQILTQAISVGRGAEVGLSARLLPGVEIGGGARIGAHSTLGVCVRLESQSQIGEGVWIDRGVTIGERASVGRFSYLAPGVVIVSGVQVKDGAAIASGTRIATQDEADRLFLKETAELNEARIRALRVVFLREDGTE